MDAALPITVAARMTPWPPKPAIRILSAAYGYLCLLMGLPIPLAQLLGELMPHQFQVIGPVAIHKLPYDDLALHGERRFAGGRAMADLAGRLVILHGLQRIAQLVAPLIQRGARRQHFDEAKALLVQHLGHRA